jgi:hypothetical protein
LPEHLKHFGSRAIYIITYLAYDLRAVKVNKYFVMELEILLLYFAIFYEHKFTFSALSSAAKHIKISIKGNFILNW